MEIIGTCQNVTTSHPSFGYNRYLGPEPNRSLKSREARLFRLYGKTRRQRIAANVGRAFTQDIDSAKCTHLATNPRRSIAHRPALLGSADVQESYDLARSNLYLPSDGDSYGRPAGPGPVGLVRRPTLEREEAFRDAKTSKPKRLVGRSLSRSGTFNSQGSEDGVMNARFGLNSIEHDEPQYSIRPAKRLRRARIAQNDDSQLNLPLQLSFAEIGQDENIAKYLISPDPSEVSDNDQDEEEPIQHDSSQHSFSPLRVIYELMGSENDETRRDNSIDFDNDNGSDYFIFVNTEENGAPESEDLADGSETPMHHGATGDYVMLDDDS